MPPTGIHHTPTTDEAWDAGTAKNDFKEESPIESEALSVPTEEHFDGSGSASVLPTTANTSDRTVDVVWYTGVSVPRVNQKTGDPYMLSLDMSGARLGRLNAGAPVFDNHNSGSGMSAMVSGVSGTRAQVGVVRKAWTDGSNGKATLQFAKDDPSADALWNKISGGIIQNLSFGTWIYDMQPCPDPNATDESDNGPQSFVATDWEPFEISPVCVPADFNTSFLSAEVTSEATPLYATEHVMASAPIEFHSLPAQKQEVIVTNPVLDPEKIMRASAQKENPGMENIQQAAGSEARTEQLAAAPVVAPAAPIINVEALRAEGIATERARVQAIQLAARPFPSQLDENFVNGLINEGLSIEASRDRILAKLAETNSLPPIKDQIGITSVTRDQRDTRVENMEAALLYRHDSRSHAKLADKARDYVGLSLMDMARECLEAAGVKTRGIARHEVARIALQGRYGAADYFGTASAASSSDFPKILENVANKSLRMAYEAYPASFKPFCRQVTASDFKPVNRVQLSDVSALQALNESGEYVRTTPSDSKETYSLATYGEVIAITRKVIINDDLQAFTRIPMLLGVAAARLEADTVWGIFTGNPTMSDSIAVFHASHNNLLTTGSSALALSGLATARAKMRNQQAPKGTPLNLVPMFILVPAALETTADQLVSPINIASSSATNVVPTWIRSLNPIVEPRLDVASTTAWYLVADPATIDTVEYAYLEGQEGVYTETRQGFEVDGLEMKARLDFAAAAVEYRGLQENAGT